MQNLTIGVHILAPNVLQTIERIVAAEKAGVDVAWMTCGGAAPDPLGIFAASARETSIIDFGTCIMPTFPRHPISLAQEAVVVDQLAPGRLRLGVGPSHKPAVEATYSIPFERPLQHLRDYLNILNALLKTGKASYHGPRLHAEASIGGPTQVRVLASALRENGFKLCGELADGAISWMCPMPYIRDTAAPSLRAGAVAAGRSTPPLVAHVPVVVSTDIEAVRAAAARQLGFYPRVPYYSQMLQDAGFPEAKEGQFTNEMADALVISGDEATVAARVRALPDMAADEIVATILSLQDDPDAWQRTVSTLGTLARER